MTQAGRGEKAVPPPRDRVGATVEAGGTRFRVWAPSRRQASVLVDGRDAVPLEREPDGHFSGFVPGARDGDLYHFRLDADHTRYPDPASRFQPDGPHGSSRIVDPGAFAWSDGDWGGCGLKGQVVYELHVGTFTPEGTWAGAVGRLGHLQALGVTVVEVMPIADFSGRFGWGYDGVNLFAPTRLYGEPDDLRRFVDAAHRAGIAVILDVVYNHLGPDGNYLACFSPAYFSERHKTDWGEAINFDGAGSGPVRDFYIRNAVSWIEEYHFDGLRLDATQSVFDDSEDHILGVISDAVRAAAAPRPVILIAENEPQETRLVRPRESGGYGLDALWNDDFHHSAMVAVTGRREAYYEDHAGAPQEFVSAAKRGYLFQGQYYAHQGQTRGTPGLDLAPPAFVTFVQNHDQVANSDSGLRFHALGHPGQARALTALTLLMPGTPMLFQGQEFWATTPFFYFADHAPDLARMVRAGRAEFMTQFPSVAGDARLRDALPDPAHPDTFARSRLRWSECAEPGGARALALHADLLRLRRTDPVFAAQAGDLDGAVLGGQAFCLRFFGREHGDRLLLVNLGRDFVPRSTPEPLMAAPTGTTWSLAWSSEDVSYGGHGTPALDPAAPWRLPGHCAVVLASKGRRAE